MRQVGTRKTVRSPLAEGSLRTVAGRAGGPVRSSGEAPAWRGGGVEPGGRVIRGCVRLVNRSAREELNGPAEAVGKAV
jgi:hypothetical protein